MVSEVKVVTGLGLPLVGNDIDTDRIIPARFLKCVTFDGLGANVFADDRAQAAGQHPFDLPQYQQAKILVVNRNFGCGSSREHAPQAIAKWGIQAIVGVSFAEIFFGNCLAMGLPCVTLEESAVLQLQAQIAAHPQAAIALDLVTQLVTLGADSAGADTPPFNAPLTMPEGPRQMLVSGAWDACGQLLSRAVQIKETASQLPYAGWMVAVEQ